MKQSKLVSEKSVERLSEVLGIDDPDSSETNRPLFSDLSDLIDKLTEKYPELFEGSSWMRDEVDRAVLSELSEIDRVKHLRKVIYGKPSRKNFRKRKRVF